MTSSLWKKQKQETFSPRFNFKPQKCHFYLLSVKYHTSFLTFYPPLSCHTYSGNTIFCFSERHKHTIQLASISHFILFFFLYKKCETEEFCLPMKSEYISFSYWIYLLLIAIKPFPHDIIPINTRVNKYINKKKMNDKKWQ